MARVNTSFLYLAGNAGPSHRGFLKWLKRAIPNASISEVNTYEKALAAVNQLPAPGNRIVIYVLSAPAGREDLDQVAQLVVDGTRDFEYKLVICETADRESERTLETLIDVLPNSCMLVQYPRSIMSDGRVPYFVYALSFGVLARVQFRGQDAAQFLRDQPDDWKTLVEQLQIRPVPKMHSLIEALHRLRRSSVSSV